MTAMAQLIRLCPGDFGIGSGLHDRPSHWPIARHKLERDGPLALAWRQIYTRIDIRLVTLKPISFLGTSLDVLRGFPQTARQEAGHQLDRVQRGFDPDDWKPMPSIGPGVREIRVRDQAGAFRVILCRRPTCGSLRAAGISEEEAGHVQTRSRSCGNAVSHAAPERFMNKADHTPEQVFASVWDALEASPADASNMRLRSDLMIAIQQSVASWNVTQAVAAKRMEVTQPRLNDLLRGRVGNFSLDALAVLAARAGLSVSLHVEPAAAR